MNFLKVHPNRKTNTDAYDFDDKLLKNSEAHFEYKPPYFLEVYTWSLRWEPGILEPSLFSFRQSLLEYQNRHSPLINYNPSPIDCKMIFLFFSRLKITRLLVYNIFYYF